MYYSSMPAGESDVHTENIKLRSAIARSYRSTSFCFSPLLCADETEICTGHNSLIEENGKIYMIYHGRDKSSTLKNDDRTAKICELSVGDKGELTIQRK